MTTIKELENKIKNLEDEVRGLKRRIEILEYIPRKIKPWKPYPWPDVPPQWPSKEWKIEK